MRYYRNKINHLLGADPLPIPRYKGQLLNWMIQQELIFRRRIKDVSYDFTAERYQIDNHEPISPQVFKALTAGNPIPEVKRLQGLIDEL